MRQVVDTEYLPALVVKIALDIVDELVDELIWLRDGICVLERDCDPDANCVEDSDGDTD